MDNRTLRQRLKNDDLKKINELELDHCKIIKQIAETELKEQRGIQLMNCDFTMNKKPADILIASLERAGFSYTRFIELLTQVKEMKLIPIRDTSTKVAILIANDKYEHLSKLSTPTRDCNSIGAILSSEDLDFVVVTIQNTKSMDLKIILEKVIKCVPEDSYFFIFYAGHGCEMCNTKFILGTDCPYTNVTEEYCVTENFFVNQVAKVKPELLVLGMDMCRLSMDSSENPGLFEMIKQAPPLSHEHKVLIISYSSSGKAYEWVMKTCDESYTTGDTCEILTGDTADLTPIGSQYASALCRRLAEDCDISTLIDRVHADMENKLTKKQVPMKIQLGTAERKLYDRIDPDKADQLFADLHAVCDDYSGYCSVFSRGSDSVTALIQNGADPGLLRTKQRP